MGAVVVPPVTADFVYFCGDRLSTQTVYEIDVVMIEPFNVLGMFEITEAHAHVDAYKYPTGGSWFTAGTCMLTRGVPVYPYTLAQPGHSFPFQLNHSL